MIEVTRFGTQEPPKEIVLTTKSMVLLFVNFWETTTDTLHPIRQSKGRRQVQCRLWQREMSGIVTLRDKFQMPLEETRRMLLWFWIIVVPKLREVPITTMVLQKFVGSFRRWCLQRPGLLALDIQEFQRTLIRVSEAQTNSSRVQSVLQQWAEEVMGR